MLYKRRFVTVKPLSDIAKKRFKEIMNSFHSCIVEKQDAEYYYLKSLNKMYYFQVQKEGNEHWEVQKPRFGI